MFSKVASLEPGQGQSCSLFISCESSPLKDGLLRTTQPGNNSKVAPKSSRRSANCIALHCIDQVGKLICMNSMTHTLYNIIYHGLNVSSFLRRIIYLKRTDWRYFFGFDKNHKDGQDSLKIQLNGLDYDCFKETYGSIYCHTWICEL